MSFKKIGKCKQCVVEGDDKEKMIFSKSNPLCAPHYKKQQAEKKPYKRLSPSSKGKTSLTPRSSLHGAKKSLILDFTREDYDSMKLSTLVKFADYYFRRYLLGKTPRNTDRQIYCPLTEKWLDEDKVHICHLSPRQYLATRWSEDNCILCAESSNVWEDKILVGEETLHIKKLREVLGRDIERVNSSSSLTPPNKQDIISLIKKFRNGNIN